jgi:NitT/TauT family transport system ATP-binding protein
MALSGSSVDFKEVTKRFGPGPIVIDRFDLAVQPGDFVSVIGPSGCGKSTLLRLISGLTPASGGRVLVDGQEPEAGRDDSGFIFQEPTLLPWLSVRRNVEVPLLISRTARSERAEIVDRMIRLVRLEKVSGLYPRQLSGGMKMRVSVARALGGAPRLLLLDEPFGALDEMTRHRLNEELLEIRKEDQWTAFFVTHSVAEAVFLSNRILVMAANPGRIHADLPVNLPFPRTADTRESPDYLQTVSEVTHALRSEEDVFRE